MSDFRKTRPGPSAEKIAHERSVRRFTALLESYVLEFIGQLPADRKADFACWLGLDPSAACDLKAAMRKRLPVFDEDFDEEIRRAWSRNQEFARLGQQSLSPEAFAHAAIDLKFGKSLG